MHILNTIIFKREGSKKPRHCCMLYSKEIVPEEIIYPLQLVRSNRIPTWYHSSVGIGWSTQNDESRAYIIPSRFSNKTNRRFFLGIVARNILSLIITTRREYHSVLSIVLYDMYCAFSNNYVWFSDVISKLDLAGFFYS